MRLLGDLEVRSGDGPALPLPPSRRTRALLGYLAATGTPQSRATLCDLLWDGPDDPRAALRWSLTKLRAVLNDETAAPLQADRDKVSFDTGVSEIDSLRVGALAAGPLAPLPLATLEDAARSLQGEFLEGLELPSCYRFHHWCMAERERFAQLRRVVLEALVQRLADDPHRALPHGRAMVTADPLAEASHATLVRLLAAAGRYPEAERHYGWARDLLRREVSLPDGGLLDEAIRAVRRQQRQAAVASAPAAPDPLPAALSDPVPPFLDLARPAAPAQAPLVGRADECLAIEAALAAIGRAPLLLLRGEPGIGKTRLLDRLSERAVALGRRVIRARCFEGEAVRPYGLWLDALRGVPTAAVDAQVLEQAAPLLGAGDGAVSREQLFDAAAALLRALAQPHPLAVVVDDLQWIDPASAALLHFVARRLADAPVLFAAAARSGEIDDNAAAKSLLQSLAREHALKALDLRPLAEDDVRSWLGDRLADVGAALRASGGNPLLLIELAHAAGAPADGRPLAALIDDRLRAFDDASRDLLGWAAAFGGEFDAERLAVSTALPVADVLARVAGFERRGLLRTSAAGRLDFGHDLVRQAVYRGLSTPRRRVVHRQIARAFDAASVDDPWLHGAVVHHASLAGDAALAARAALAAGQHWLRVFANAEAAQVAERGLALLDALAPDAQRARLEIGLLRLRVAAAAAPGADLHGHRLSDLCGRITLAIDAALAHGLHAEAGAGWEILAYGRQQSGDAEGARDASLAAERCTRRADEVTRCRQLANTGRCLVDIEADGERGRRLLTDAAALAAELELPMMELDWGRGLVARADGDLASARESLARAVALARAESNHWREYECMLALATTEYELGLADEVLRHAGEVAAAAQRMGEPRVPFADALTALVRLRRGEPGAASAVAASLDALRERDDKAHLAYVLNESAAFDLAAGEPVAAARQADEALAAATAVRRTTQIARARATMAAVAASTGRVRRPSR